MITTRVHNWRRDLRTPALRDHLRAMEQEAKDTALEREWQRRIRRNPKEVARLRRGMA